ncbi:MAG: HhoA/HhoB/HtrA family serine endopeptidase [Cyanobacteria bacterium P01_A01_bin.84]
MRFFKLLSSTRQLTIHFLSILLGAIFTLNILQVSPSKAEPAPSIHPVNQEEIIAQVQSPAIPRSNSHSFVASAVNRVGPAVVRIDTERTITRRLPDPFFDDPVFRRFFGDTIPEQTPQQQRGLGSGVIFDKSGLVLTNAHVVSGADKVTVHLKDGRQIEGKVKGVDEVTDLAVVQINAGSDLPVATLGSSSTIEVGDWAIAVGNPLGFDNTVTLGIVSTLKRPSAQVGISDKRLDFIQTDAAINPGNSGGPLVNDRGEVIGINTAIRADAMGIGFAIPIDKAKTIATKLQRGEKVSHPFLGIQMQDLTPEDAKRINSDPNTPTIPEIYGIFVVRVVPNSPASAAGIRPGDIIVQVDGKKVNKGSQLLSIVENTRVGQALQLKLKRGNRIQELSIRTADLQDFST